jgi:hypothetical protein
MAAAQLSSFLCLAGLLVTLSACAAGTTASSLADTPASAATAAAPATAPEKAAPKRLTSTEINEQCWMSPEINKVADLDKRSKLVDKCVADRSKAQQGM